MTPVNGAIPNGDICSNTSTPDIPAIEVSPSDSPPISFQDDDSSTAREDSLTPPAIYAGSAVTPGRRAMMALQKVRMLHYCMHTYTCIYFVQYKITKINITKHTILQIHYTNLAKSLVLPIVPINLSQSGIRNR